MREQEAKGIMIQVLDAVSEMHKRNIYHLDIKPGNIFYNINTKKAKLIDFGLSRLSNDLLSINFESTFGVIGCPEVALGKKFTPSLADSWKLGSTIYLLMTGIHPTFSKFPAITLNERLKKKVYHIMQELTQDVLDDINDAPSKENAYGLCLSSTMKSLDWNP